jgi:hypothetical protein
VDPVQVFKAKGERRLHSLIAASYSLYCMPNLRTPPNSRNVASGTVLSDTTPLKRDAPGTVTHSCAPKKSAAKRYADMTFDTCEKFVGPMPVNEFFEEFVPEALTPRPKHDFSFSKSTVSQNEDEFVSSFTLTKACKADYPSGCRNSQIWTMP